MVRDDCFRHSRNVILRNIITNNSRFTHSSPVPTEIVVSKEPDPVRNDSAGCRTSSRYQRTAVRFRLQRYGRNSPHGELPRFRVEYPRHEPAPVTPVRRWAGVRRNERPCTLCNNYDIISFLTALCYYRVEIVVCIKCNIVKLLLPSKSGRIDPREPLPEKSTIRVPSQSSSRSERRGSISEFGERQIDGRLTAIRPKLDSEDPR